ncbi:Hypothetical protein NCS54_00473500 [Fusarium falciforme]|uniref:Hypothetical protein n=1 Tax=Fusarium falciforme TaxID=195108 RepID=UPI002301DCA8|nr:Hypothetical protein NCS54_00473500 [Fusarium falciforme]WAO87427.1 Hypothetical protein NCS54_00473500 [Fusarium falciforme]
MRCATLAGLALLGGVAHIASADTIDGMEIVPVKWELELKPGGEVVHLTGTVEEVYPQLLDLNPTYDQDWAGHDDETDDKGFVNPEKRESDNPASVLWKRSTFLSSNIKCNTHTWASCYYIRKGIEYLRKVKGKPVNDPGKCGRVSCSYNSGIYWCNTSSGKKTLNSFGSIADGAQAVHDKCLDPDGQFCWVRGRASHTTNWNVLVTGQQC